LLPRKEVGEVVDESRVEKRLGLSCGGGVVAMAALGSSLWQQLAQGKRGVVGMRG